MVSIGGTIGRISQGMAGVGSKLAPAAGAVKTVAPFVQGASQTIGQGIGWAAGTEAVKSAKGLIAKPISLLRNIIPENVVGWYVLLIMVVFWYSWMAGFAAPLVLVSHISLAVIGFFLFVYIENSLEEGKGSLWQIVRRNGMTFLILIIIDVMLLKGQVQWHLVFIAALLLAFREGSPLEDLKRVVMVVLIASAAAAFVPFLYNWLNRLFFSTAAKIVLPFNFEVWSLNFSYLPFILGLLANRTFTYPFFWFTIFGLSKKTRVARSLAWIIMFLFIFALWPNIAPEVDRIHNQYITGATPEQKEFWPNIFKQAGTNFKGAITSIFQSLTVKTSYAYESAQATFGFGEPKEEPKMGLALVRDSTMLKKYDISYRKPEPSFIMRITSLFPTDTEKPYIEVTKISCEDKLKKLAKPLEPQDPVTSRGLTPTEKSPVTVFYNGPDGGTQVKCPFKNWVSGDYTIAAEVDYKVDATAFLTTAFIRTDQDEALRKQGIDPAVVNKIPPADARYDNVPVTLTWGPPDLTKSPASVDVSPDNKNPTNMLITVYVSKNSGWENSEIKGVKGLTLTVPSGVSLVEGDSCDFEKRDIINPKIDIGLQRRDSVYAVKEDRISKVGKDGTKAQRFIGDAIRFECGMTVGSSALSGADWAPARFDVTGSFIFTTKLEGITFTVENSEVTTQQQIRDKCTTTGGTWNVATATAAAACDCGSGKQWDDSNGCVTSSTQGAP